MRIEHVAYFKFDELTDDAKEKARTWYRNATASERKQNDCKMPAVCY